MENIPSEFIDYLCQRLEITNCLLIGSSGFHKQGWKPAPRHIISHFIHYNPAEENQENYSTCRGSLTEGGPVSLLERHIKEYLQCVDTLHTLAIVEAEIYLADQIPASLASELRDLFQSLPFCLSIGHSEETDYRKALEKISPDPYRLILQGFTNLPCTAEDGGSAWIELLGTHFTPNRSQIKPLQVAAVIIAHNESDIIEHCLTHLHEQGIQTHLIDDESDDFTGDICRYLLKKGILTSYQRSGLADDCELRWSELLTLSSIKAKTLDADWIIHHDADEIRESPWLGVNLSEAISIIDSLGYNCIDHTVIELLFTDESNTSSTEEAASLSPVKSLTRFRFPSHKANFTQLKGWKNADLVQITDGGHKAELRNLSIFPFKFLIKHYPLRSLAHARRKVLKERSSRLSAERKISRWHTHYDLFQHFQEILPWTRRELHLYNPQTFYTEFLIERLSGCGLDQTDYIDLNQLTSRRIIEQQEEFRTGIAQAFGFDLMSMSMPQNEDSQDPPWTTQSKLLLQVINSLVESRNQALSDNRQLLAELDNIKSRLALILSRLQHNQDQSK